MSTTPICEWSTDKSTFVKDSDLGHVARVVADDDLFTDVGGQGRVEIAQFVKMNAISPHHACFGGRQQ